MFSTILNSKKQGAKVTLCKGERIDGYVHNNTSISEVDAKGQKSSFHRRDLKSYAHNSLLCKSVSLKVFVLCNFLLPLDIDATMIYM